MQKENLQNVVLTYLRGHLREGVQKFNSEIFKQVPGAHHNLCGLHSTFEKRWKKNHLLSQHVKSTKQKVVGKA